MNATATARPVALAPLFNCFPSALRECHAWVLWRYELDERGRWTKVPYRADGGGKASTTAPKSWATLAAARSAYERGGFDGVGLVLTNGVAGVDADKCVTDAGEVEPWASDVLSRFKGTYRERSPSGRGYRIFLRGTPARCGKGGPENRVEVYAKDSPRYLTVTGHALDEEADIADMQPALDWLHAAHMTKANGAAHSVVLSSAGLSDDEVLDHARRARNGSKFMELWAGGHAGHASASEADAALVALLAFYTSDAAQIDRLVRRSGLCREKWDERRGETTYGELTIANIVGKGGARFGEAIERPTANAQAQDVGEGQAGAQDAPAADSGAALWPDALDNAAYHGIAGEFVQMTEPRTESDPAALLVQFLIAFGALVGRGPHFYIDGAEHHANLFALLIGPTSKGRKGTSWARVREVFERIPGWKPSVSGLSSGEGVKFHVRDPREETKPNKRGELVTEIVDAGESDKRLLVIESEFAGALRAAQREASTLSATIREAWDTGNLRTLTKRDPVVATGAHVCIVGHITAEELRAELASTDIANGFANRLLFVATKRSKLLPRGGGVPDMAELQAFAERLARLAETARTRGQVDMRPDAWAMWDRVYPDLSAGGDGLHASATGRAEAQTLRLALLYCLLDGAEAIEPAHLLAALAVWSYCDATAKYIFGTSLGDRIADAILRRLQAAGDGGLTRDDLRNAFQRNTPSERIGAALDMLQRRGKAKCEKAKAGGAGRPAELWRATL